MGVSEVRSNLIKMLGSIEDERLLRAVYDFLKEHENEESGSFWASLSEAQKNEINLAYKESEEDATLPKWEDIKNKY
jgi:hypothetical protein